MFFLNLFKHGLLFLRIKKNLILDFSLYLLYCFCGPSIVWRWRKDIISYQRDLEYRRRFAPKPFERKSEKYKKLEMEMEEEAAKRAILYDNLPFLVKKMIKIEK